MMVQLSILLALGAAALVAAAPAPVADAAPAPSPKAKLHKRESCTFSGSTGASLVSVSKADCATITLSALTVPSGTTLDLEDLTEGTKVIFEGVTTFEFEEWSGPLVSVSGTDITVTQTSGAYLDGQGALYWDGEGSSGGVTKPKFFAAHSLITSTIENIYIYNAPVQVFSVDTVTTLALTDITVNNIDGDSLGANTDGFDIGSSTGVTITGANIYNQDDCVAVNSGSNIIFTGGVCSGGHGLSIGSVGGRSDNTVSDVTFESSEVKDSQNGCRIKTISGDTGSVTGVTYKDITLSGITEYGIVIRQDYDDSGVATTGVPITDLTMDGISGTVDSGGYNIWIYCGDGSCSDWVWEDIDITGGATSTDCQYVPSEASCTG